MYKVRQGDLKGNIQHYPIEIVQRMVYYQELKDKKCDIIKIQNHPFTVFDWSETTEGYFCWSKIFAYDSFYLFYVYHPKEESIFVYYRGDSKRANDIFDELIKLGGKHPNGFPPISSKCFYYIRPSDNEITCISAKEDSEALILLKEFYIEKFLPEIGK